MAARLAAGTLVTAALLGVAPGGGPAGNPERPPGVAELPQSEGHPSILEQVNAKVAEQSQTLTNQFNDLIKSYTGQMEDKLNAAAGRTPSPRPFPWWTWPPGRSSPPGSAAGSCCGWAARSATDTPPGFIDMTGGGTLENGQALVKNHLYMATIAGRGFTAQDAVKVLVRGEYTVS